MTMLVIDVGSSSVRALLFDDEARLLPEATARRDHHFDSTAQGQSTADPASLRRAVEDCIDRILRHPQAKEIEAAGMATFVGNLLGLDEHGEPVTPLYTYADTRASAAAAALSAEHDAHAARQRTGCRIHSAYHPAKLRWLAQAEPAATAQVRHWVDFATYCYRVWFGRLVPCSFSVAAWSGLLNREALTWDETWLRALKLAADQLPPLADYDDAQAGLCDRYARRWPALRDVPFYLALGDGAAANIGSGGASPDRPVLTLGTTAALRVVQTHFQPVPPGLWAYRVDRARHLIGGATSEGGSIYQWALAALRLDAEAAEAELRTRPAGAHGLVVLPLLAGERSPGYCDFATGTLHGLRLSTTPIDILQALLEGVALRLRLIDDLLGKPGEFVLAGGGALEKGEAWAQMLADALGRPLRLIAEREPTAKGIALLIRRGRGAPVAEYEPAIARMVEPRPDHQAWVDRQLEAQQRLYRQFYGQGPAGRISD
ncbi:MAG: FGGY family carbohydrate kinase [Aggregatilineales bacterium]